jgi:hypothetical protein
MTMTTDTTCVWACPRCGHRGEFTQRPKWGNERYVLEDWNLCFDCYRKQYAAAVARWAAPPEAVAGAGGVVTAPGRALLADDVVGLVNDPERSILKLAISVAHVVAARAVVDTLELTFDLAGVPQIVIVGAPLPYSFVRDLAAVVATDFAPLQRKVRG